MGKSAGTSAEERRRFRPRRVLQLVLAGLAIAALIKEMRLPKSQRTWHGLIGGIVPYDFRWPPFERIKRTLWDPNGAVVVKRAFGVGWSINFGAVAARVRAGSAGD